MTSHRHRGVRSACLGLLLGFLTCTAAQTYTALDLGAQTFTSIAGTGTQMPVVSTCDDCTESVTVPFPFVWYGSPVTSIAVSSNGQINMDGRTADHCCSTVTIPSPDGNDDAIFFVKEDINPGAGGTVYYELQGSPGSQTFTIEFAGCPFYSASGSTNVQVILYESPAGQIDIIWGTGDTAGNSFSAGVEAVGGLDGTPAVSGAYFGATGVTASWPTNTGCRFELPCSGTCPNPVPLVPTLTGPRGSRTSTDVITVDLTTCATENHTPSCDPGGDDALIRFVAPFNGTAQVDTCSAASFDTVLAALDGGCGSPELACNDDTCGTGSQISFPISCNQPYTIVVDGHGGATGTADVTVSLAESGPLCMNILVYDDTGPGTGFGLPYNEEFLIAATNLGHFATLATDETMFNSLLLGGATWDMVILDVGNYANSLPTLDNIQSFLNAGNPVIYGHWDAASYAGHPIFAQEGVMPGVPLSGAPPALVADWTGGPLVTTPHQVPDLINGSGGMYGIYGQSSSVTTASAEMGYTPAPTPGQVGVAIGTSGRFIFNSFAFDPFSGVDSDGDTIRDNIELAENEITFLIPVSPPTCTAAGPVGTVSGEVQIDLTLDSPTSPTVDVTVEFSTDAGATWVLATMAPASPMTNPAPGLALGPAQCLWDTNADGVGVAVIAAGVIVRAVVDDGTATGQCLTSAFEVDNTALCQGVCGDCNLDGSGPAILDALVGAQIAAGVIPGPLSPLQQGCCDVDAGGTVTILDALIMAQSAAGLPVSVSCL